MGRNRPTLETLLKLLVKAELFRAADYVACDILKRNIYDSISFNIFENQLTSLFYILYNRRETKTTE